MKTFSIFLGCSFLLASMLTNLSTEPFKYKYEITSETKNAADIYKLYDYKEKLIDIYNANFLTLSESEKEKKLILHPELFKLDEKCRPYYISGTIVVLIGEANGVTISGDLMENSCDQTVIRTKIFIFDIFR